MRRSTSHAARRYGDRRRARSTTKGRCAPHRVPALKAPRANALVAISFLLWTASGATAAGPQTRTEPDDLDQAAEFYVELVLAVAEHWPDFLDSYYGPEDKRAEVAANARSLAEIRQAARDLASALESRELAVGDETNELRRQFLLKHADSLTAAIDFHQGAKLSFDQESRALFDTVAPRLSEEYFHDALRELDRLLPGAGDVQARYRAYRGRFALPSDKVEDVVRAALDECRARTRQQRAATALVARRPDARGDVH